MSEKKRRGSTSPAEALAKAFKLKKREEERVEE